MIVKRNARQQPPSRSARSGPERKQEADPRDPARQGAVTEDRHPGGDQEQGRSQLGADEERVVHDRQRLCSLWRQIVLGQRPAGSAPGSAGSWPPPRPARTRSPTGTRSRPERAARGALHEDQEEAAEHEDEGAGQNHVRLVLEPGEDLVRILTRQVAHFLEHDPDHPESDGDEAAQRSQPFPAPASPRGL